MNEKELKELNDTMEIKECPDCGCDFYFALSENPDICGLCSEIELVDELIELFQEYRENFGISEYDTNYPDENPLTLQSQFEDKFASTICKYQGHKFVPDHCGLPQHDYCDVCKIRREEIL